MASRDDSLAAVCGLLTALASPIAEHGLQGMRAAGAAGPGH